jgi:hypothetical protein
MKTLTVTNTQSKLNQIKDLFHQGVQAWVKAGEIIVEVIDDEGLSLEEINHHLEMPLDVLATLEKIGRKQVNPQLLLSDYPAARHLERLPMSEQERLMLEPVDVLLQTGGTTDMIKVQVQHMTREQVKQVFARNYIRPIHEQRAWIEGQRKVVPSITQQDMPYEVNQRRHTVLFRAGCEVTRAELARLVAQLQD